MSLFRELKADEIEVRIQSVNEKGVQLLLYKNARVDMAILDETFGPFGWCREHYECKGNLYCKVGVKSPDGEWVWKADCGAESFSDKEKGEASDSFKRACVNWGIGRELYTGPRIYIFRTSNDEDNFKFNNGKCYDKFSVQKIKIVDGRITGIAIKNDSLNKRVFVWSENNG